MLDTPTHLPRAGDASDGALGRRLTRVDGPSKVQGQAVGRPLASRYQLLHPVFQIVVWAASCRSRWKRAMASGDAEISWPAPERIRSMSCST